jgi:hypothetical protein
MTTVEPAPPKSGCRYYGMSHVVLKRCGQLVSTSGNECGVMFHAHAPCAMEVCGAKPNEKTCAIARAYMREHGVQ